MDPNVLHNISYGMYVISANKEGAFNGQIANTVFQITNEPVVIAISINKQNLTCEFIETSLKFSVSILDKETPLNFIGKFGFKSGRKENKFKDIKFKVLASGCPVVLDNAIAYLETKVINKFNCGTHTLFLGELINSEMIKIGNPMTYAYYHEVKHGVTPDTAPTFIKEEVMKIQNIIDK
ncbi:MAG: flavin reductase [Armatimonadetes bacterium]|nr:flavin reductase [Armatimonadota bacterium]